MSNGQPGVRHKVHSDEAVMVTERSSQGPARGSPRACGEVRSMHPAGTWFTVAAAQAVLPPGLAAGLADRYTIERALGRGGMATVYLALDRRLQRRVALKILHPELAASTGALRFVREIAIAARLTHPHILPLLDSGEAGGMLYYVMPYVDGETLRDRLTREQQLTLDDALAITREVADALGYAHGQGIVHRDIKPENILLEAGHAVVSDFGIARAIGAAGEERFTATGLAVGTPAYMSPEQAVGSGDVDGRSDLYSLGCVLYEMLGGEPPYTGPTPQAVMAKRLNEPVPHIRTLRETVPPGIELAITRVLAKAPVDRFATAHQFVGALRAAPETTTIACPFSWSTDGRMIPIDLRGEIYLVGLPSWRLVRGAVGQP